MNPDKKLPNIDYFPVPRERIEVDPGGSLSMEVHSHKRPCALTPAERKRKSRAAKSAAQKEEELARNRAESREAEQIRQRRREIMHDLKTVKKSREAEPIRQRKKEKMPNPKTV